MARWQIKTLNEWETLPQSERDEKMAWEMYRWQRLDDWYERLTANGHNSPEVVTLIELARLSNG